MSLSLLKSRSNHCELCSSTHDLKAFELESKTKRGIDSQVLVCSKCHSALNEKKISDVHHWRNLQEAIWNENIPVKVLSYRILSQLRSESWAQDLMDQIYLEEEDLEWAKSTLKEESFEPKTKTTIDSNGTPIQEGDSVTLIKDLDVKGGGFTAKRGTLVKGIRLTENPEHIEGRVNGIQIVLVAKFLKKV
jgi:protein PhnA